MARSEREVIAALLQQLESEERALSRRRQKLHARIATFTDTTGSWEREEREIAPRHEARMGLQLVVPGAGAPAGGDAFVYPALVLGLGHSIDIRAREVD